MNIINYHQNLIPNLLFKKNDLNWLKNHCFCRQTTFQKYVYSVIRHWLSRVHAENIQKINRKELKFKSPWFLCLQPPWIIDFFYICDDQQLSTSTIIAFDNHLDSMPRGCIELAGSEQSLHNFRKFW